MKSITSRENSLYKELKQLATSVQARRKLNCTLLDGVHLCQMYLQQVGQPQWCVVNAASQFHPEIINLLTQVKQVIVLTDALYPSLSQVEQSIGIFFVIAVPTASLPEKITHTAVMLENLQDPGNLGTLLRSAAAARIRTIFCSKGTVSAWSPKVMRAGMGAHFLLNIVENVDLPQLISSTQLPVLATSSHAQETLYDYDLTQSVIWLFGHEGQGLSKQLMQQTTKQIAIPHRKEIESLNVAACAAICFFEQVRRNLGN